MGDVAPDQHTVGLVHWRSYLPALSVTAGVSDSIISDACLRRLGHRDREFASEAT